MTRDPSTTRRPSSTDIREHRRMASTEQSLSIREKVGYSLGDLAANSPIVTGPGGSRNQFIVGSALSWRFSW